MNKRAIIVRSTSLGDFICMVPFLNDLKELFDEIVIFEISKSSSISSLLITHKKIKTIHLNSKNKLSLFIDFIKNNGFKYRNRRQNIVFFSDLSRLSISRKLIYKILLYKKFGLNLKFHPYYDKDFDYCASVDKKFLQLDPLNNVSKIPYLKNNLKRKMKRINNINFLSLPRNRDFLSQEIISIMSNNNLNIALFISAKDKYKIWDLKNWVKIIKSINKIIKCNFFLIGGPSDLEFNNFFCEKNKNFKNIYNLSGKFSPKGTISILRSCDLYIGNDAAPMHMSAFVGLHCISIFCNRDKFGLWEPLIANSSVSHRPSLKFKKNSKNFGINTINYKFVLEDIISFINNKHIKNKHIIREHLPKNKISTISIQNGFYDS